MCKVHSTPKHCVRAGKVQSHIRGYLVRRRYHRLYQDDKVRSAECSSSSKEAAAVTTARNQRTHRERRNGARNNSRQLDKYLRSLANNAEGDGRADAGGGYSEWCAERIQSWWRMVVAR